MTEPAVVRTVEVRPPSLGEESLGVFRGIFFLLFSAFFVAALHRSPGAPGPALLAYQVEFAALPPSQQRIFRELQDAAQEIERVRGSEKRWLDVAELGALGIAPFATDPLLPDYRWSKETRGLVQRYSGAPGSNASAEHPAYLVKFVEPESGSAEAADPRTPLDEEHHRLKDGTLIHVTIWMDSRRETAGPEIPGPEFRQLVVGIQNRNGGRQ